MHPDTFNADFYLAAATVIPILLLALTLQGRTFEELLNRSYKELEGKPLPRLTRRWRILLFTYAIFVAMFSIIALGFAGEWFSILSLDHRAPYGPITVKFSILVLLVIVISGPTLRLGAAYFRWIRVLSSRRQGQPDNDDSEDF
jgi:hypothetical protein